MADDPERPAAQLLDVAADAARMIGTRLATFFTVGVYVAVTIAATTDEMLVKGNLVTLPLLDTQIPISGWFGFYTVAPWLIVVLHLDCLLKLCLLGTTLREFEAEARELGSAERRRLQARLPSVHHVQFFVADGVSRLQRVLSGTVLWSSMIVFPVVLLCAMQVRCLALHDASVTTSHRLAVLADVALVLTFFWHPICVRRTTMDAQPAGAPEGTLPGRAWLRVLVPALCALVLAFCAWAGIPGDRCAAGPWNGVRNLDLRGKVLTATPMSAKAINGLRDGDVRRRERQLDKVSRQSFLQGRDLNCADFSNAVLPRLDLRSLRVVGKDDLLVTQLQGADFRWAQMQQVLLDDADLRGAMLEGAQLQGGSLERVNLEDANLARAQLQDAKLPSARGSRASLQGAQLQGADLSHAVLHDADLSGANLQGANLHGTQLQGADLTGAALEGADVSGAGFDGAEVRDVRWTGAFGHQPVVAGAIPPHPRVARAALDGDWSLTWTRHCDMPEGAAPCVRTVVAYLVELACADAYVARGLGMRALATDAPERTCLREALRARGDDDRCKGIALLPVTVQRALAAPLTVPDLLAAGPHR